MSDESTGSSSDVITTAELNRLTPGLSVLDAVEHARPWFLHPRGGVAMASIDGSPPTDASVLQMIPIAEVREIRLVRSAGGIGLAAIRRDGTVAVGDVVVVITRKGRE